MGRQLNSFVRDDEAQIFQVRIAIACQYVEH